MPLSKPGRAVMPDLAAFLLLVASFFVPTLAAELCLASEAWASERPDSSLLPGMAVSSNGHAYKSAVDEAAPAATASIASATSEADGEYALQTSESFDAEAPHETLGSAMLSAQDEAQAPCLLQAAPQARAAGNISPNSPMPAAPTPVASLPAASTQATSTQASLAPCAPTPAAKAQSGELSPARRALLERQKALRNGAKAEGQADVSAQTAKPDTSPRSHNRPSTQGHAQKATPATPMPSQTEHERLSRLTELMSRLEILKLETQVAKETAARNRALADAAAPVAVASPGQTSQPRLADAEKKALLERLDALEKRLGAEKSALQAGALSPSPALARGRGADPRAYAGTDASKGSGIEGTIVSVQKGPAGRGYTASARTAEGRLVTLRPGDRWSGGKVARISLAGVDIALPDGRTLHIGF